MNIKETALQLAHRKCTSYDHVPADMGIRYSFSDAHLINFAEALVAELAKENKPVLVLFQHDETGRTTSIEPDLADDFERLNKRWYRAGNLYTIPPTAAQIEQETAEAIAKYLHCIGVIGMEGTAFKGVISGAWKEYK